MAWGQPLNGTERTGFFAATVANTFHSRRGYLNAPADASPSDKASAVFVVAEDGDYSVLVRYEHGYRFNAAFKVVITSTAASKVLFTRDYGWREGLKLWAFASARNGPDGKGGSLCGNQGHSGAGLQAECLWPYGATENIVWEGIGATVKLAPGEYSVTISGLNAPSPSQSSSSNSTSTSNYDNDNDNDDERLFCQRNIDTILLMPNATDISMRMEQEGPMLPLDGLLSQAGSSSRSNVLPHTVLRYILY